MRRVGKCVVGIAIAGWASFGLLLSESAHRESAWSAMVRDNPAIVDDASVTWKDRLVLSALTMRQAEAYYSGARAEEFVLDNGQTLAEYMDARLNRPGNVYVPLPGPCELASFGEPALEESASIEVRGRCGIPDEATAVILQVTAESAGSRTRVKVWASDLPEPAEAVLDGGTNRGGGSQVTTTVVSLAAVDSQEGARLNLRTVDARNVHAEAVGYFRPLNAGDGAGEGSGILLSFEGPNNSFFGLDAGALTSCDPAVNDNGCYNAFFGISAGAENTEGRHNAFFGYTAGDSNTTGDNNAFFGALAGSSNSGGDENCFFGRSAGRFNTSGDNNAFFGRSSGLLNMTGDRNVSVGWEAGDSNTEENDNTFLGAQADLNPGPNPSSFPVTNATAVGANAYVSQSNSLVLGSINGVNGATASTQVGIGVIAPQRLLHIAGPNAVFRMDRSTNSAAFLMVRTDGAGNPLKTYVLGVDASGANNGEFVINDLATAVAGPGSRRMTINNAGNVAFTGSVTTPDLIETSSLRFKTNVRTLEDPLDLVRQLRGVRFDWKDTGKASVGLIAEEVAEVLPELVALEVNGEVSGVNYSKLVAVLVEAVKAQEATIEGQREEIDALKGRLAEMDAVKAQLAEIQAELAGR